MWPQSWIKGKEDVLRELKHWEGAKAQPWAYSVSHGQFLVRLYREEDLQKHERPSSLYLFLKVCDRVAFDSLWSDSRIRIEEKKGKYGPEFIVSELVRENVDSALACSGHFVRAVAKRADPTATDNDRELRSRSCLS